MTYTFDPLSIKGETTREKISEIKNWLDGLNENLEYILNHIDLDNLSADFREQIESLVNGTDSSSAEENNSPYVTKQGESGGWFYRKWSDGIVECSTQIDVDNYGNSACLSGSANYPFTLTQIYSVNATINDPGGNSQKYLDFNAKADVHDDYVTVWLHSKSSNFEKTDNIPVSVTVVGKWK